MRLSSTHTLEELWICKFPFSCIFVCLEVLIFFCLDIVFQYGIVLMPEPVFF
jgi:hypothetical protein